jgi:cell division transport system permease protein
MITIITRILQYGIKNFWRNGWLSAATVAVMVMSLCVLSALMIFSFITERAIFAVQDKIDVSVYFNPETSEDEGRRITESLKTLPQIKEVRYVSNSEALEVFKARHSQEESIQQALNELGDNPLLASVNIRAKSPDLYEEIAKYLTESENINKYVQSISYYKNQEVITRLNRIIHNVNRTGVALTVVLAIIAGLMIFNTIWIATFSNREEISIMRVVGASNLLVRGPYVVEGVLAGGIAAVLAMIVTAPVAYYVTSFVANFIPGTNVFSYYFSNFFRIFWWELVFGVGVGAASSFFAVRRYLRN